MSCSIYAWNLFDRSGLLYVRCDIDAFIFAHIIHEIEILKSKTAFHKWLSYLLDFFWPIEPSWYFWKVPLERFIHCGCGSSAGNPTLLYNTKFSCISSILDRRPWILPNNFSLSFVNQTSISPILFLNCLISPKSTFVSGLIFMGKLLHNLKSSS